MDDPSEYFEIVHYKPCSVIKCNNSGTTYTLVRLLDDSSAVTGTLSCTMKYRIKDCNPVTGQSNDHRRRSL
jgi:coatomer protein complex subunit gamma